MTPLFSPADVEAAAKAEFAVDSGDAWESLTPQMQALYLKTAQRHLNAAVASLEARGAMRTGGLIIRSDDKWVVTDFWNQNEIPVAIIRIEEPKT